MSLLALLANVVCFHVDYESPWSSLAFFFACSLFSINCVVFGHLSSTFFLARFKHPTHDILFVSYQLCCRTCSCLWNFFNIQGIFLMILK